VELAGAAAAAYSDSAEARMAARDYLGARYFAELALARVPDSAGARDLLAGANSAIEQGSTEGLVFESRLRMADSLLSYGKYEEALAVARAIGDVAPENDRARLMVTKTEFNYWQDAARRAFSRGDLGRARGAVDSALVRFPGQPACVSLRSQIDREIEAVRSEARRVEAASPAPVGAATKDVEEAYRSGQGLFKSGHLADAVSQWEKVEALAPGYQSVRTYLVNAYKYLGVELYTQNHLQEAVDVWRKAAKLAPDSAEIANYIRRTEGEMARLKELSYERR